MELWTLGELAERVEAALADYPSQANGRVRAVPDQRTIRWYTTTGLVDRPTEMRGRTALYSHRHLLQLVAIKRRQSQGQTIAQIQSELAGATNQALEPIAALPPNPPKAASAPAAVSDAGRVGGASDAAPEPGVSAGAAPAPAAPGGAAPESAAAATAGQPALARARFWADRSPEPSPADTAPGETPRSANAPLGAAEHEVLPAGTATGGTHRLAAASAPDLLPATSGALAPEVAVVAAVRIADGVTVVLDQGGAVPDVERLAAAAGPLLAELRRQGLLSQSSGDEL